MQQMKAVKFSPFYCSVNQEYSVSIKHERIEKSKRTYTIVQNHYLVTQVTHEKLNQYELGKVDVDALILNTI